jgi:dihydroxyacetone kinase
MGPSSGSSDHTAVVGLIIAIYGGCLATINSIMQIVNHRKDRADVILKVRTNMAAVKEPRYANMKLTLVTATNRGKRPVTIQGFATKLLDTRSEEYLLRDIRPPLPHEITEGREVTAFVNQAGDNLKFVEFYYVWDSVGRNFKINMAPWYRRLVSRVRGRIAPVKRLKN